MASSAATPPDVFRMTDVGIGGPLAATLSSQSGESCGLGPVLVRLLVENGSNQLPRDCWFVFNLFSRLNFYFPLNRELRRL